MLRSEYLCATICIGPNSVALGLCELSLECNTVHLARMSQATIVGVAASVAIASICGCDHVVRLRRRRLKHVLAPNFLVQAADVIQAHICTSTCRGADMVDSIRVVDAGLHLLTLLECFDLLHLD